MVEKEHRKSKNTERKTGNPINRSTLELQLERIAQEWRAVFDSVPDFISVHDTEYNIIRVNRAFASALGARPADLIGKKCYKVFHDTDEPWPYCPHARTLETRQANIEEIYEPSLRIHLEVITSPIFDENNQITGTVHIARDMTKRRAAEEALKESEKRYRELTNLLPQIVFEVDTNLRITFANRQALEMSGYTEEDFEKGLSALDMLVPEYRQQAIYDIMLAMNTQESQQFEFTMRRKDGSTFPASVFMNPIIQEGKITGLAGIVIDLTEEKKLEQLKDEFIGMVSHELRTPLTTIIGSVNMVRGAGQRLSPQNSRQLLTDAVSAAEELSNILSNLLELSRVKADRLILHLEPVNVKTISKEVVRRLRPRISSHRFLLDIPRAIASVPADPLRLERILHNLIENAVKYSPKGSEIHIVAKKEDEELIISVSDQGIGISKADQAKLFSPFRRLEEIKTAGAGLGLLVCRRLVEAHHGRIWVESVKGRGSTFHFTIPLNHK